MRSEKQYYHGTHRTRPPEDTWRTVSSLLDRVGITRVADITRLDRLDIPVYQSVRPLSRNLTVSQGKGTTPAAARVSAVMESIEMWHAECLDHLSDVSVSLQEMRYGNPIDAGELRWMTGARPLEAIPIRWVRAESLIGSAHGWLPRDMVELDFTGPAFFEPQMFVRNSNGLASGNEISEALLHGVCELIERHAWFLAQVEPGRLEPLDLTTLEDPSLLEIVRKIADAGFKLAVFDITWELGVPAAFAKLVAPDLPVVWHGSGCHPSPIVAISRAVTEAAQSRLTYIAGARDDLVGLARGAIAHRAFEDFEVPPVGRACGTMEDLSSSRVADDLDAVVQRLEAAGFEPFFVDLTRPDIGCSVVSTFVPGLREMHG